MAKPMLSDELWTIIEPLLPPSKARRPTHPGRKPIDNRRALTGILFVLRSGIPWEYLPREMGCGTGMTCWRRLRDWKEAGVWDRLHKVLLEKLHASGKIDWSRAVVDSASVRAMARGKKRDRVPWTGVNMAPNTISWSMAKDACPWRSR
jgi:transposase